MKMISWSDRQYYDINLDADVSRISGFDDHHMEHWIVVQSGKGYRDRRNAVLEVIMTSIERGDLAGEAAIGD
jgi:hypothetical protein